MIFCKRFYSGRRIVIRGPLNGTGIPFSNVHVWNVGKIRREYSISSTIVPTMYRLHRLCKTNGFEPKKFFKLQIQTYYFTIFPCVSCSRVCILQNTECTIFDESSEKDHRETWSACYSYFVKFVRKVLTRRIIFSSRARFARYAWLCNIYIFVADVWTNNSSRGEEDSHWKAVGFPWRLNAHVTGHVQGTVRQSFSRRFVPLMRVFIHECRVLFITHFVELVETKK